MYINHCTAAIIHWMKQEKQISVDDLVCDALFDEFSQMKWSTKIGHSFRVLPEQPFRFIRCQTAVVLMGT